MMYSMQEFGGCLFTFSSIYIYIYIYIYNTHAHITMLLLAHNLLNVGIKVLVMLCYNIL